MIPIISLANFLNFAISLVIALRLFYSYQKWRSSQIGLFALTFFFTSAFFLALSTPGILSSNPIVITYVSNYAILFGMIAAALFITIPLTMLGWRIFKMLYVSLVAAAFVAVLVMRTPVRVSSEVYRATDLPNFIFWILPPDPFLQISGIIGGLAMFISLFLAGILFIVYAFRNRKEHFIFIRSLMLGSTVLLLGVSSLVAFTIGAITGPGNYLFIGITFFTTCTLILMILGIFYHRGERKEEDQEATEEGLTKQVH